MHITPAAKPLAVVASNPPHPHLTDREASNGDSDPNAKRARTEDGVNGSGSCKVANAAAAAVGGAVDKAVRAQLDAPAPTKQSTIHTYPLKPAQQQQFERLYTKVVILDNRSFAAASSESMTAARDRGARRQGAEPQDDGRRSARRAH